MNRFRKLSVTAVLIAPLLVGAFVYQQRDTRDSARLLDQVMPVSYTHLTLPTNREV